jgi:hypothetical protein
LSSCFLACPVCGGASSPPPHPGIPCLLPCVSFLAEAAPPYQAVVPPPKASCHPPSAPGQSYTSVQVRSSGSLSASSSKKAL